MGLADRFKADLKNKDIFRKFDISEEKVEMSLVSNPIQRNKNNFEELETEIINKIRKTPYWMEYSSIEQRKMIGAYFSKKLQKRPYTMAEKEEFVQNILILSNNR